MGLIKPKLLNNSMEVKTTETEHLKGHLVRILFLINLHKVYIVDGDPVRI